MGNRSGFPWFAFLLGLGFGLGIFTLLYLAYLIQLNALSSPDPIKHILALLSWVFGLLVTVFIILVGFARFETDSKLDRFEDRLCSRFGDIADEKVREQEAKLEETANALNRKLSCAVQVVWDLQDASMWATHAAATGGDYARARQIWGKVAQDQDAPPSARARALSAQCTNHLEANEFDEAIQKALLWIKLEPAEWEAHRTLGLAYGKQDDFEKSIEAYEKALSLEPEDAMSLGNIAEMQFYSGTSSSAERNMRKAISLSDDYRLEQGGPRIVLAASLAAQGKRDEALGELKAQDALRLRTFKIDKPDKVLVAFERYQGDPDFQEPLENLRRKLGVAP